MAALPHGIFVLGLTKDDRDFCQEINELDDFGQHLYQVITKTETPPWPGTSQGREYELGIALME